ITSLPGCRALTPVVSGKCSHGGREDSLATHTPKCSGSFLVLPPTVGTASAEKVMATVLPQSPGPEQPLLNPACNNTGCARRDRPFTFCCSCAFALCVLCNAAAEFIYRVRNPWEVCLTTGVSIYMLFLYGAVGASDRALPEAARREKRGLRFAIWALATLLNFVISLRAAPMVPMPVLLGMWSLVVVVACAGLRLLVCGTPTDGSQLEDAV
ncbi:hypothetical protein Taro_024258, partial [Colocasia esculenta]|nr:hypothetical protein [Colocasia esculenta]